MTRRVCTFFASLVFSCASMAEVYKWVDENGKIHFGDNAPQTVQAEPISESLEKTNIDTGAANDAATHGVTAHDVTAHSATTADSGRTRTSAGKTQDELDYEKKKAEEKQAAIAKPCSRLKKDIAVIASGARVAFYDKDGKEYNVLEKDRASKLEEWKAKYKKLGCQ